MHFEQIAHALQQCIRRDRLLQQHDARVDDAVLGDGVFGIAGQDTRLWFVDAVRFSSAASSRPFMVGITTSVTSR